MELGLFLLLAQLVSGCGSAAPEPPAVAPSPLPVSTQDGLVIPAATLLPPAVTEARMLTLEFPTRLRVGDSDWVRLTLEVDQNGNLTATAETAGNLTRGEIVQIPNVYATHYVIAETRLDMAGLEISPSGTVSENLRPGHALTFYWSIRATEVGVYRGTLWFYLRFAPISGGPEQRQALSAQKIQIEAVNFFGLAAQPVRWLGAGGVLLGTVLGLPFAEDALRWLWRKIRAKSA